MHPNAPKDSLAKLTVLMVGCAIAWPAFIGPHMLAFALKL
jgi:hypothetical protein